MQTAAYSASGEVAEDLLSYFVDIGNKECFAAMLYLCFDLLSSDYVEELSWQHGLNDFYMPFRIQVQRSLVAKVASLEKQVQELTMKDSKKEQAEADTRVINPGGFGGRLLLTQGNGYPAQAPTMMANGTGIPSVCSLLFFTINHLLRFFAYPAYHWPGYLLIVTFELCIR